MSRLKDNCPGDCATCPLLAEGRVDMIPCVLDQLFRRMQNQERMTAKIVSLIERPSTVALAANGDEGFSDDLQEE